MENIKTVEVIKALIGLEVGDTLTRENGSSNFELNVETVGEDYTVKRFISLSPSLLNKDEFKAIEWFVDKRKEKKNTIAGLEAELEGAYNGWANTITQNEKELNQMTKLYGDTLDKKNLMLNRIDEKLKEFNSDLLQAKKELEHYELGAMDVELANEKLVVYTNMIDLLEKIKA